MVSRTLTTSTVAVFLIAALLLAACPVLGAGVPNAIGYQGKLTDSSGQIVPDRDYPMRFNLFDAQNGGNQLWDSGAMSVAVSGGVFTVDLQPITSATLTTDNVWLETTVASSTLPRVRFASVPFALRAADLVLPFAGGIDDPGPVMWLMNLGAGHGLRCYVAGSGSAGYFEVDSPLSASPALYAVTNGLGPAGKFDGTVEMTGFKLTSLPGAGKVLTSDAEGVGTWQDPYAGSDRWSLNGNAGTSPGTNFIGTTDDQAFEIKVNNERAWRIEPNATSPNILGGYSGNAVSSGVLGATIGGGGQVGGYVNRVTDSFGTVAGGEDNRAGDDDADVNGAGGATVAGGEGNIASGKRSAVGGGVQNLASGEDATVAGGASNQATYETATVGGGQDNHATASSATVAGGWNNAATNQYAAVGGGRDNDATASSATVAGGWNNAATNQYAAVGGGSFNGATGRWATIPGGRDNLAEADNSFAAGTNAHVRSTDTGTFVWADPIGTEFASTGTNQFLIRATGGVGIGTNYPSAALHAKTDSSQRPTAIQGESSVSNGTGVVGIANVGANAYGVWGTTTSGWAGCFGAINTGNGVYISAPAGRIGLTVASGTKNAVVATSSGARLLYTEESSEVWFTDYGFGKLDSGRAAVAIDATFAETVNLNEPYHVFVQVNDPECEGVAVTNRTATGFDVVELRHGQSNAEFSFRIVAKRKGYENARLERAAHADNDPNLFPGKVGVSSFKK